MKHMSPWPAVLALVLVGCGRSSDTVKKAESHAAAQPATEWVDINGAGAAAPYELYSKWISEYQSAHPSARVHYRAIGSRAGVRQILDRAVDFGATETPMRDTELARAPGKLVHVPMTLGAVVVAYNLPTIPPLKFLKLSPDVLAAIYLGEINTWNDPKIVALNPGPKLPGAAIKVAYRTDGGATTAVFTDYLSHVSPRWKEKVGAGKSVRFPVGLGWEGNEGIAAQVKNTPGTLAYVELAIAKQMELPSAALQNRAGRFIEASLESITAAAASSAASMPDDLRMSLVDASGEGAYPICAFSYILVYEEQPNFKKGRPLAQILWWAVHDGQNLGLTLDYGPLPERVVAKVEVELKGLQSGGRPLLSGS